VRPLGGNRGGVRLRDARRDDANRVDVDVSFRA
jgi:hypothetical protein